MKNKLLDKLYTAGIVLFVVAIYLVILLVIPGVAIYAIIKGGYITAGVIAIIYAYMVYGIKKEVRLGIFTLTALAIMLAGAVAECKYPQYDLGSIIKAERKE